jgi:3-oxoacyl-[acyl-carrier protein] reductase
MDFQLKGKTALVTGASQGLGRAIARRLAREGARLAIAARRKPLLEELAQEIANDGGLKPLIFEADFCQAETPVQLATAAEQALGSIDILINAAGGSRMITFDAPVSVWDEGIQLNFSRLRELTHAIVPGMKSRGYGRIVNLTGSSEPRSINVANAAKAAVHVWSKALSREFAQFGITINCLQPGRILTEQIAKMYPTAEARKHFIAENIPAGRFGEPDELAVLATFLSSPLAAYVTGTVIPVDGGMSRFAF